MKKTLMVLSFALCATFAFAQTKNVHVAKKAITDAQPTKSAPMPKLQQNGYKGTIFSNTAKDEVVVFSCDFHANNVGYTTGTVGANEMVDGTVIPAHGQIGPHSWWNRIADTTAATRAALYQEGEYPATFDGTDYNIFAPSGFNGFPTGNNGLMLMTMQDQITGWGGHGRLGNFDAYMKFDFSSTGVPLIRVSFTQTYRKFNRDRCYIDYSNDGGTTWSSLEINVRNVDVAVNGGLVNGCTSTLPLSMGNQANASIRIRWMCSEPTTTSNVYGYYWAIDDVVVKAAPDYSKVVKNNSYFEGFYQLMPQGFEVPMVYDHDFVNDGLYAHPTVTANIYNWMEGSEEYAGIATKTLNNVASDPMTTRSLIIDPLGFYDSALAHSLDHGFYGYPDSNCGVTGPNVSLATTDLGVGMWQSQVVYTNDTSYGYPMAYTVNFDDTYHNGRGVWARDHGNIGKGLYFCYGMISANTYSTDPDDVLWNQAGYSVLVEYVTGNTIPEGWKILGVELVAATYPGMNAAGGKIEPLFWMDSAAPGGDRYVRYLNNRTGASTHTVQANEVYSNAELEDLEYAVYGINDEDNPYRTVFMPFPNQPTLEPNRSYRVGYQLAEETNFAVATNSRYFYRDLEANTYGFYRNEPGMEAFSYVQYPDNPYSAIILDPYDNEDHVFMWDEYPMIRMIVGPGFYIPKYAITLVCDNEEEGMFQTTDNQPACGMIDSIAQGGAVSYYMFPAEGYTIDKVYLDGAEYDNYAIYQDEDNNVYGQVRIEDVQAAHTLKATYKLDGVSIDEVAGIAMKLQPNPATSNVKVSIHGVSGNVNMSLIDMSGRVITSSEFNAENGTTINVSNLAKGAYFVRITNDKFSKVEKLIVR